MVYTHMTELIHNDPRYTRIRFQGVILDSCPSEESPLIAARALRSSIRMNFIISYIVTFLFMLFVLAKNVFNEVRRLVGKEDKSDFFTAILEDPNRCPQLFLYSKGDDIVKYEGVESYIAKRKSVGVNVTQQCWDDSPHVQHFRHHREAYITSCTLFIDECLSKLNNQ